MENRIKIIDSYKIKGTEIIIYIHVLSGGFYIGDVFSNKEKTVSLKVTGVGMDNIINKSAYSLKVEISDNKYILSKLNGQEFIAV